MQSRLQAILFALVSAVLCADDAQRLLRIDHYVRVRSAVPATQGRMAQLYVREVVQAGAGLRGAAGSVVLFIHGAGTPAEVAFDVPYRDYSWMAYLAAAGFDVFSMDMSGYGRSTRPDPMDDPCNLSKEQQSQIIPSSTACGSAYGRQATTIESDWNDIGAVVDYLRALRRVEKVSLIGWSLGGPRAGGYAARNPAKVAKLVLLSPAYGRTAQAAPPQQVPAAGAAFNVQSRADFDANWDRQIGCADQVDPAARTAVWNDMLASDPVGATWGTGVRRAPNVTWWGWNSAVAGGMRIPALFVAAALDKQVLPDRVRDLHADYGASDKVLLDLGCASHNALWERNHALLFQASLEWLAKGSVNGTKQGTVRLGY